MAKISCDRPDFFPETKSDCRDIRRRWQRTQIGPTVYPYAKAADHGLRHLGHTFWDTERFTRSGITALTRNDLSDFTAGLELAQYRYVMEQLLDPWISLNFKSVRRIIRWIQHLIAINGPKVEAFEAQGRADV